MVKVKENDWCNSKGNTVSNKNNHQMALSYDTLQKVSIIALIFMFSFCVFYYLLYD